MQLYQIQQEHLNVLAKLEESEGVLDDELLAELGFTLEAFQEKAVSVGFLTKQLDDGINAIEVEMKRLKAMKDAAENRLQWFKTQLQSAMNVFDVEKIETPTLKISFGKSEAVIIEEDAKVPEEFTKVKYTVTHDKVALKGAIKSGRVIPGVSIEKRTNIQIR